MKFSISAMKSNLGGKFFSVNFSVNFTSFNMKEFPSHSSVISSSVLYQKEFNPYRTNDKYGTFLSIFYPYFSDKIKLGI